MAKSIYHKVRIRFTKKTTIKCVRACVCFFSDEVCFSFPDKNDGFQLHLEENIIQ